MPTDVLRVAGDYRIEAKNGNVYVDLTSASSTGTLTVNGNLTVIGTSTNISTVDSTIKDNIVVLNSGEINNYVTKGTSGILIARGNNDDPAQAAQFLYDDTLYWNDGTTNRQGVFKLSTQNSSTSIQVDGIRISSNVNKLNFLGVDNPLAVLSVAGTTDYELQVLDDDDIPNKKYVDSATYSGTTLAKKLQVGNSFVEINDPNVSISDPFYSITPKIFAGFTSTNIVFKLEGTTAIIQGIRIDSSTIRPVATGTDLTLDPSGSGLVIVKSGFSLLQTVAPLADPQETRIYTTSTVGGGGTGLYFVNTSQTDELVSRKRAIIYGIIF